MNCLNCGTVNRDEARFCKQCGTGLVPVEPSPASAPVTAASVVALTTEAVLPEKTDAASLQSATPITEMPEANPPLVEQTVPVEVSPCVQKDGVSVEPEIVTGLPPDQIQDLAFGEGIEQRLTGAQDAPQVTPPHESLEPPVPVVPALTLPLVVVGRYELTEVIEQSEAMVVCRAHDRQRCWQCGALRVDETDVYCSECGAEVGSGALCRVQVGNIPPDAPPEDLLPQDGVIFWIQPEPIAPLALAPVAQPDTGLRLRVGYASDKGAVRELDEDSVLVMTGLGLVEGVARPSLGLFAVADGMGGYDNGQVASRRVIQVLAECLLPRLFAPTLCGETILPETFEEQVRDAVKEANRRLTHEAQAAKSDMGSTLTLALVHDGAAIIANVGDSRTYLWRGGELQQVTEDHSMVARLVAKRMLEPDEIYTHPRRSEIYRVMGDKLELEVDIFPCKLQSGDRLVLCCDGAWEMIRSEGIADVLLACPDDPQAACDEMVKRANAAGGEDNISVIVVDVR